MLQNHVPLLFHPALHGEEVARRRRTALVFLQRMLVGAHKSLEDLGALAELQSMSLPRNCSEE